MGSQVSKGSLTFPSDPLAAMRELGDLDSNLPVLTEARGSVSTEAREDASEEGRTEARQEASADVKPSVRKPAQKGAPTAKKKSGRTDMIAIADTDIIMKMVEEALASREPLIGGVKATVDMSPELSTRSKRYLADHRGQNTRQVMIALLDTFLAVKGY